SIVHQAVHYFNEQDLDVGDFYRSFPAYAGYLESWVRFAESGRLQPVLCEHKVASLIPRYVGTFDCLGVLDGAAALLDFATGDPEDAAKHLQTAAYVMALQQWAEEPDEAPMREFVRQFTYIERFSVQLMKSGDLPKLTRYRDPRDFTKFRLIAEVIDMLDT